MVARSVTVGSAVGLHARPASLFVEEVTRSGREITLTDSRGHTADGRSILSVLALGVAGGETVTLSSEDPQAVDTLDLLARLLARDLDAEADTRRPDLAP